MLQMNRMKFNVESDRSLVPEDNEIVQKHVSKALQAFDLELFTTKWFDYRRMTPLQATLEYTKEFNEMYRVMYARTIDARRAPHVACIAPLSLLMGLAACDKKIKLKFSGLWRGRQVADALGMPYAVYLEHAFDFRMRNWQQSYLPEPSHLYHEYDVEKIQAKWEELQAAIVYMPTDPAYLVQNYKGLAYQNDFHEWCFKQAALRYDEAASLASMIIEHRLPYEKVANRVSPELFERVKRELL